MRAVGLTRYLAIAEPQSLLDFEVEKPVASGHDLLVRIEAVSVNPVDTKIRSAKDKLESTPKILGYDAAGVIESAGDRVTLYKPGDEVFYAGSVTRQGTNSQFHLVDERIVGRKPDNLDFAQAAALPLTALTAWELLFDRMGIDPRGTQRERSLLIIAGAGGLGSIMTQLAKIAGLKVIATASRADSIAWCREMGADHVIDHRQPLTPQVKALGLTNVDYIANLVDGEAYWSQMAELIAPQGRIGLVVGLKGPVDMELLKNKSASVHWEFMFTRSSFQTADMIEQHHVLDRIAGWIETGKLRGTAKQNLGAINAQNLRSAHAQLESGSTIGKLVLAGW
jgi:NADPH:quinone reductase